MVSAPSSGRPSSLSSTEPSTSGHGRVLYLTGVSGGGKGTVVDALRRRHPELAWSVSFTTRKPRPGEVDGVHYHFVDDATFDAMVDDDSFVEWAHVYGHRSGTPREPIENWRAGGRDVLVEGDTQGAFAFKVAYPDSVVVFLKAPDLASQRERLMARGTTGEDLERRMAVSERQIAEAACFDAVVVNEDVDETIRQVERLFSLSEQDPEQRIDPN